MIPQIVLEGLPKIGDKVKVVGTGTAYEGHRAEVTKIAYQPRYDKKDELDLLYWLDFGEEMGKVTFWWNFLVLDS